MITTKPPSIRRIGDPQGHRPEPAGTASRHATGPVEAQRLLDRLLAAVALPLLVLPAWLLAVQRQPVAMVGRSGLPFQCHRLIFGDGLAGRLAARLGAQDWPRWWNVWAGDMAVVGPRPRGPGEAPSPAPQLRPGLVNDWAIRQHTAVDYGTEDAADRQYAATRSLRGDLGLLLRSVVLLLLPGRPAAAPQRIEVADVTFDNLHMHEALARMDTLMASGRTHQVAFVNPACVNIAAAERGYRRTLARCAMVLPDGIGIKLAGALLGTPLKQNLNGTDLFPELCQLLARTGRSVYLLGGRPGVPEAVAAEIARRWPTLRVAGVQHGYFGTTGEAAVVAAVRASGADCLLVARGVPVQEQFIDRHLALLGVGVALGVGGLFDFVSGRIPRAPVWMRDVGLEWVWRLRQEPGRMWRRYLVGNLTFLSRVVAQRAGWRQRAAAVAPVQSATGMPAVRAVVLATQAVDSRLPLPPAWPAALLPLGHQSAIEHLVSRLAQAGVQDVDIVAGDHVPALRELLGDGERWGVRLHWRLPAPGGDTGACLAAAARMTGTRLIVGPAHVLPDQALLGRLAASDLWAADLAPDAAQPQPWRSAPPASFLQPGATAGAAPPRRGRADDGDLATVADADGWNLAQQRWLGADAADLAPASWIRKPWGVVSPTARVHPTARLLGPVLIGPGCIVEAGAEIGPMAVLTRDVIVGAGTVVRASTVLPSTYVGPGLTLDRCIVHGEQAYHFAHDASTRVARRDAALLPLHRPRGLLPALVGRAVAVVLWLALSPALGAVAAWRWCLGGVLPWRRITVLSPERGGDTAKARLADLTLPRNPQRVRDRVWATLAALSDVARGRRVWFGARPRTIGQWHALPRVWQQALAPLPVGLVHAPAWADTDHHRAEAQAVADVYGAHTGLLRRLLRREFALR
jgi:N-acetylglucosaminyldiphosphoundecaprenol N-acetyl-beta-D-mannosaminyltransferase